MTTILEQERAAGYAEGYDDGKNWNGQHLMCARDEAFYEGQKDAWSDAPSRLRWWLFGAACGAIAAWWFA